MSSNTPMRSLGWFLGMLSWGATIAMLVAPNWEVGAILGDSRSPMDGQGLSKGLWFTCSAIPSSQTICTKLPNTVSGVQAHVVAARSILIVAVVAGFIAGILILVGFKCIEIGPSEEGEQNKYTKIGGSVFLLCGVSILAASVWYYIAVQQNANFIPISPFSGKTPPWNIGEAVQITIAAGILWAVSGLLVFCFVGRKRDDECAWKKSTSVKHEYV